MKKHGLTLVACLLGGLLLTSSCVGSFGLFNTLATWNKKATKSKFLNEIIFLVISPAYAVCSVVDVLVLNTIEFWTGNNPMTASVGTVKNVLGQDGRMYAVKTLENGYEITDAEGKVTNFLYDKKKDSWSMQQDGLTREVFRFNADGTVKAFLQDGRNLDVSLNEEGLYEVRTAVNGGMYFALR